VSLLVAAAFWWRYYRRLVKYFRKESIWDKQAMRNYFRVNSDIFVRTLLLSLVTTFFTFASSAMGETILAVNALLMAVLHALLLLHGWICLRGRSADR